MTANAIAGATPKPVPTWAVITVLSLAGTTVSLQQTMVVPLLPAFQHLLQVSADDISWLVTATLLTAAVATPVVARLADMHGKRLMMLVCIILMTAGSLVAALSAGSFVALVVGRSLQGFSAALIPVGISIMRDELPRNKVGSAIALMSATLGIGGALGLPLGGILFDQFGWQSVFWLSAGVGVAIGVAVLLVVSESKVKTRGQFDVLGAILLSIALTALLLVISKGGSWGWKSQQTILLLVLTAVALAFWVPYSLRVSQPLVDLRTSARRPILLTNIASILVGFALMANMLISTQQLQQPVAASGFGLTAVAAGLAMVPSGLAMVAFAPVSGTMINRLGGRVTLIAGGAIMAVAYLARVFYGDTVFAVILGSTVVGIGSAVAYAAMPSLIMANVPITETASANGLNALLRALGTSTASAVIAALLSLVTVTVAGQQVPALAAFQDVFWLAAVTSLICCGVAWFVPKRVRVPITAEAEVLARVPAAVTQAGENAEIVARGWVMQASGQPISHAVVTALRLSGEPLDWSRADNNGAFSLALPGLGRYLLIINADGWTPRSEVVDFADANTHRRIQLNEPLMLTGRVLRGGSAVAGALVTLSATTGEFIATTNSDAAGRYRLRLPPPGHHILTVLEPDTLQAQSIKIFTTTQSAVSDVELLSSQPITQLT
jgi:EmrB/QacA subfamily drug resistance transporter